VSIHIVASSPALEGNPGIDITLASADAFPGGNELPILQIGSSQFDLSRFGTADGAAIVFTLTPEEFQALSDGAPVSVQLGVDEVWQFGSLHKSMLQ
jgi:hypothetical protein